MPIPDGYPFHLSDDELARTLAEMFHDVAGWPPFDTLLPELKLAIIQAGLLEQARREADASEKVARRSLHVAIAALAISTIGLLIAWLA